MWKRIIALGLTLFVMNSASEAKTYVNSQHEYQIVIPEYMYEVRGLGSWDAVFRGNGIQVTLRTDAFDLVEVDTNYVNKEIARRDELDAKLFPNGYYKTRFWAVRPNHFGTINEIFNNGFWVIGTEVIAHGKKIGVAVSGDAYTQADSERIVNIAYDILESFECLKH